MTTKTTYARHFREKAVPKRWLFYMALALATLFALLVAWAIGLPRGPRMQPAAEHPTSEVHEGLPLQPKH